MKNGFSLVELSIVLVILGLLTGGILSGQSLIRAAEMRSIATDLDRFQTAIMTFRDRYMAVPGDMKNATTFWGTAHATPATCRGTIASGTLTCNGDGDGRVQIVSAGSYEMLRAWQHLANAQLVEGTYTGVGGPADITKDSIPGLNCPAGKMGNSGFHINDFWNVSGVPSSGWFAYDLVGVIGFGARLSGFQTSGNILTPEEAWSIDKKMDDGIPSRGRILSNVSCSDAANNLDFSADYLLTNTSVMCSILSRRY